MVTKESLAEVNQSLNSINIERKGSGGKTSTKSYVMVNERVKSFRQICPDGCITTKIIEMANGVVTMQAEVYDDSGKLLATGFSQEKEANGFINKTSYIENAETSAVGRALGFLGIGIDGSMASAEEVANAIIQQDAENTKVIGEQTIDNVKVEALLKRCVTDKVSGAKLCAAYKVENFSQLTEKMFRNIFDHWDQVVKECS